MRASQRVSRRWGAFVRSRTRLQLVRQFEERLLIVDDVQVLNAGPHLSAVHPDDLVA